MNGTITSGTKIILSLLVFSLVVNVCFMYVVATQSNSSVAEVISNDKGENFIEVVYDLDNYKSTSYENQTLRQRIDRMYEEFLRDRKAPKDSYYEEGKIDAYWKKKCINSIRRIMVMGAKIDVIEKILNITARNNVKSKQEIDLMIENKKYHDKLLDMSNFYARFINDDVYQIIQTTLD